MNILLVDDSAVTRVLIQSILSEHKDAKTFKFFNAENGQVALDILAYNKIDICFIDWNMPVMDGEELIKNIHDDNDLKQLLVIVATAESSKENVIKMAKLGIDAYLVKPFEKDAVTKTFDTVNAKKVPLRKAKPRA